MPRAASLLLVGAVENETPAPAVEALYMLLLVVNLISALARNQNRPKHKQTLQTATEYKP